MLKRHQFQLTKTCVVCRKEFRSPRLHTKTCSTRCRKRLQRQDPTWIEPRDRNKKTG